MTAGAGSMLLAGLAGARRELGGRGAAACKGAWRALGAPAAAGAAPELPAFDHQPSGYTGAPREEVLAAGRRHLNPALKHLYKEPLFITEGKMQYLYDDTGKRYLDCFAGIVTVSVGHCHPTVNAAVLEQHAKLQHTTCIYTTEHQGLYAKELAAKLPGDLSVVYFVNSGSEANDLAHMMARLYTGNHDMVALRNCYHGASAAMMNTTAHATWKYPVAGTGGVLHAMNPNPYRGVFGNDGPKYAAEVQDMIQTGTCGRVAGFIAEPIQGVGGSVPLADGYLPEVYRIVREAGGLCISDEVQTGFGRTGSNFWGFQNHGVMPDIVTMAKGIGNGFPLAAVVTTPEIANVMNQRLHFNTYGGNPVCSAAGRAVLRVIEEEGIQENAAAVGEHFLARLRKLQEKYDLIGDVRGQGLMLGVEMVKDRATKEPATAETLQAMETMRECGLLIGKGGLHGNVYRLKPPMCLTKEDADFCVDVMDYAFQRL